MLKQVQHDEEMLKQVENKFSASKQHNEEMLKQVENKFSASKQHDEKEFHITR
jgi:hypothetical protein